MKSKILFLIIPIFLLSLVSVSAISDYCGDGVCANYEYYNETNPLTIFYCPADCGVLISSEWCEDTYALIAERDCPTCPICPDTRSSGSCSICDISRIPTSELNDWCSSNGANAGTYCPFPFVEKLAFISITGYKCKDGLIIFGVIVTFAGGFITSLYKQIRKKRKK